MLIPYDRPRGSVHSLDHLSTLSDCRSRILCVSDRTLYLLLNYASRDIDFQSRFATNLLENGYLAVDDDSAEYELWADVVNRFKIEVTDMTCDIESGLLAIADALRVGGGGGCSSYGNATLNCIVDLNNEQLLGPEDETQGNPVSDPPPEGFATWDEYFAYKCQAAHFIWDLERKNMAAIRAFDGAALTATIVGPVIAGLAGLLPAAFTPPGFVAFVAVIVAMGLVAAGGWWYVDEMIDEWDANKDEIICALYNSGTSVQAVSALSNALEDAIQAIVTWGVLAPVSGQLAAMMSQAFAYTAGNGMVEPLFKSIAAVSAAFQDADCDDCGQGYPMAQTSLYSPYNVLTQGDSITAYDDDPTNGYQAQNSGTRIDLEFVVDDGYTGLWSWSAEYKRVGGAAQTAVVHLQSNSGSGWVDEKVPAWTFPIPTADWTDIGASAVDINFSDGVDYRLHCQPEDFNEFGWYRKFNLQPD